MTTTAERLAAAVDEARPWTTLMAMAGFGAWADGVIDRAAFSSKDVAAGMRMLAMASPAAAES